MPRLLPRVVAALLVAAPCRAQSPAPPERPLGPGDPLPRITIDYREGSAAYKGAVALLTKGAVTMGDVRLQADRIEFNRETLRIVAGGNVVLTRGDESLRGESFIFDPENAEYRAETAVVVSPPFYVAGKRIQRTATGIVAQDAVFTACPEGKGEFRLTAREIEIVDDRYLVARRPTFYLFGARILSLPRIRYVLRRGKEREREEYALSVPITIRSSRISGLVVGVTVPFSLGQGYDGGAGIEVPSKGAPKLLARVEKDLIREPEARARGLFADPTRRDEEIEEESDLRRFLRARPLPPPPDPVLDFEDILPTQNPLSFPTRTPSRLLRASVNVLTNQEIGEKRTSPLLLTRAPELRLEGRLPLAPVVPADNAAARRYLRRPRPLLTTDITIGHYRERELEASRRETSRSRAAATVGIGTLPLLIGSRLLFRPSFLVTYQAYSKGASYAFTEINLATDYVFAARTALGFVYIKRFTNGETPFTFDRIDTQSEAQARLQWGMGKYTLAGLARYDLKQQQLFDFELSLGIRLRCIEPRLTYRRLGQQIGLTLTLPGLTQ